MKSQKTKIIQQLLTEALKRKQISRPEYSLRALARDLGVSPAFASNMLSGKRHPPKERLADLCRILELDINEKKLLYGALLMGIDSGMLPLTRQPPFKKTRLMPKGSSFQILSRWWHIAVLESLTLDGPANDLDRIRTRLGLTHRQLEDSLQILKAVDLIEEVDGQWRKKEKDLYFPAGRSKKEIRDFHDQMIQKAKSELLNRTSDMDYQRRLINGFTFAMDPKKIEKLKKKILGFLDELSLEAADGNCSEVYQCNVQFFPLFKK